MCRMKEAQEHSLCHPHCDTNSKKGEKEHVSLSMPRFRSQKGKETSQVMMKTVAKMR